MRLKKGRRFGLPYERQLKIYATCLNYINEPSCVQHKIESLCHTCGGEYFEALFEAVTTDNRNLDIALKHYLSEPTLGRLIEKFYKKW